MLNDQKPLPLSREEDGFLDVHSVFPTIQGEGPFAGHPATFVRLYGCNLQCPFCDTEYTSTKRRVHPQQLAKEIQTGANDQLIVITGGEPFRQNITPFVNELIDNGHIVQIETNGTLWPGDDFPWDHPMVLVVCSPKTGKIHPETAKRVTSYKYVLDAGNYAPDGLPVSALGHPLGNHAHIARPPEGWSGPIYINPMDEQNPKANRRNIEAVAHVVRNHPGYIMGVQMHKLAGIE